MWKTTANGCFRMKTPKFRRSNCFWVCACFCRIYLNRIIFEYLPSSKWVFFSEKRVLHYAFNFQKQSFADVLRNRCSWKFCKFHRKTLKSKSLFNKVAETLTQVFSWEICKVLTTPFLQNNSGDCFWILICFISSTRLSDSVWRSSQVIT